MPIIKSKIFSRSRKAGGFLIGLLFFLSFFLVFINKTDQIIASKIKTTGIDVISPIAYLFSYPIKKTTELINNTANLRNLHIENVRLQEEVKRLKQWQTLSFRLIDENKAYKKLLNVSDDSLQLQQTLRVLTQTPSLFINTIQLSAGSNKEIINNSSVINERGLVGRIIDVGKFSSRVLLITDINSSVPVVTLNQDIQAIVKGQPNSKLLKLKFIKENKRPIVGQILVTSGNAGIFPRNIAVGKIFKVEKNDIYAKPFVNFKKLNFVNVVTEKK
tara:strand:+ start:954 stop:1775 length:822 start_codon:yes stop_codon:yes gene_type:complete